MAGKAQAPQGAPGHRLTFVPHLGLNGSSHLSKGALDLQTQLQVQLAAVYVSRRVSFLGLALMHTRDYKFAGSQVTWE